MWKIRSTSRPRLWIQPRVKDSIKLDCNLGRFQLHIFGLWRWIKTVLEQLEAAEWRTRLGGPSNLDLKHIQPQGIIFVVWYGCQHLSFSPCDYQQHSSRVLPKRSSVTFTLSPKARQSTSSTHLRTATHREQSKTSKRKSPPSLHITLTICATQKSRCCVSLPQFNFCQRPETTVGWLDGNKMRAIKLARLSLGTTGSMPSLLCINCRTSKVSKMSCTETCLDMPWSIFQ